MLTAGGSLAAAATDTTGPRLKVVGPTHGAIVAKPMHIGVTASDVSSVRKVTFAVDGVVKEIDTGGNYGYRLDPRKLRPGIHHLTVTAVDKVGNARSRKRTFRVSGTRSGRVAATDTAGPSLSLTAPAAGSTLSGYRKVTATSSDVSGVKDVRFYLDGALRKTELLRPYEWYFNWSSVAAGNHTMKVVARDRIGFTTTMTRGYNVGTVTAPPPITSTPPPPPSGGASDAQFQSHWQWLTGEGAVTSLGPWDGIQAQATDRIVAVSSPRQGIAPYSLRITVKPGDFAGNGNRAELWEGGEQAGTELEGTDKYYSFATMFPTGFQAGKWTIFHQLHGGSGRPVVAFQGTNGTIETMMRGGDESAPTETKFTILPTIQTNVWHDFVYHVKWFADGRGQLEVWHRIPSQSTAWDKVLGTTGPVGYKSGGVWNKPYPKLGMYRDPTIAWTTVVYQGGIHLRASSFAQAVKLFG